VGVRVETEYAMMEKIVPLVLKIAEHALLLNTVVMVHAIMEKHVHPVHKTAGHVLQAEVEELPVLQE
jgi:hypothetical protein